MKKITCMILAASIAMIFSVQGQTQKTSPTTKKTAKTETSANNGNFVDKNNNGICDHHEAGGQAVKGENCAKKGDGKGCQKNCTMGGSGNCNGQGPANCQGQNKGCGKEKSCQHKAGCGNTGNKANQPAQNLIKE